MTTKEDQKIYLDGYIDVPEDCMAVIETTFDAHQTRTKASDWFQVTQGIAREYSIRVGE